MLRRRGAEPKCRASEAPPTSPNSHTYPPDQLPTPFSRHALVAWAGSPAFAGCPFLGTSFDRLGLGGPSSIIPVATFRHVRPLHLRLLRAFAETRCSSLGRRRRGRGSEGSRAFPASSMHRLGGLEMGEPGGEVGRVCFLAESC